MDDNGKSWRDAAGELEQRDGRPVAAGKPSGLQPLPQLFVIHNAHNASGDTRLSASSGSYEPMRVDLRYLYTVYIDVSNWERAVLGPGNDPIAYEAAGVGMARKLDDARTQELIRLALSAVPSASLQHRQGEP